MLGLGLGYNPNPNPNPNPDPDPDPDPNPNPNPNPSPDPNQARRGPLSPRRGRRAAPAPPEQSYTPEAIEVRAPG